MSVTSGAASARGGRIAGLDLVRGVAIFLVMLRHGWSDTFPGGGIIGVGMFFALSGYLITGLLQRDIESRGHVRWIRFYAHRVFRLYPALLLLVAVYTIVEAVWSPLGQRANLVHSVVMVLTYTTDLPLPWGIAAGLNHLWSLAVEEQFYLVWPLTLFVAFKFRASLGRVALGAALLFTVICIIILCFSVHPDDLYERPTTWASTMVLGGCARLYAPTLRRLTERTKRLAAVIACVVLGGLVFLPNAKILPVTYILGPAIIAITTVAILLVVENWRDVPVKWLRPLAWLGLISYAAYLWDMPVVLWCAAALPIAPWWYMIVSIVISIAIATISWFTVEAGGRRLRLLFDRASAARHDRAAKYGAADAHTSLDRS
jgi:peptidoglycan/LPS O-acetylase OafA/YrhL